MAWCVQTCLTVAAATQGAGGLTYSQWLEMLLRIAESRLGPEGHSVWHESHPTLPAKVVVLFDIFMKLKYLDTAALNKRMLKARSSWHR